MKREKIEVECTIVVNGTFLVEGIGDTMEEAVQNAALVVFDTFGAGSLDASEVDAITFKMTHNRPIDLSKEIINALKR